MKITIRKLQQLGACEEAVEWLTENYPKGLTITSENLALVERDDWVCWLTCKLSESYRFWCAGVAFREVSKRNPSLEKYSMNVTEENWQDAKDDAYAADADADAYLAAAYLAAASAAAAYAADAAAYAADAAAAAARSKAYKEMREEAEKVLLSL